MRNIALIILIIVAACSCKQNAPDHAISKWPDVMFPFGDTTFSWKGIEKPGSTVKNLFIKQVPTLMKHEYEFYDNEYNPESKFVENCRVLDINNDGNDDVIYTGSTGGEGRKIVIFLNINSTFKKVFEQTGFTVKLDFREKKIWRIYISDQGCCDDWMDFNWIYELDYTHNTPEFKVAYLTGNVDDNFFPQKYFKNPVYFEVLNNDYKVRNSPVINDIDDKRGGYGGTHFIGNNIDTLKRGTKGRAIAAQTDNTGRVWWLVEIDRDYNEYGNLFHRPLEDSIHKASRMGWISSRFVKKINP